MSKYMINYEVDGYETTDIDNSSIYGDNNTIVLVLNNQTSEDLSIYYNRIIDIIISGAKLIAIDVNNEAKIRKAIFMLMALYKNYNIYKIDNIENLDNDYLEAIEQRDPDIMEVQQFIGGEVSAYADLSDIIISIARSVKHGDINMLKSFVEKHMESIESSPEVIDYLKKIADTYNSKELIGIINDLKDKINSNSKEISTLNSEIRQYKGEVEKLKDDINSKTNEIQNSKKRINSLTEQLNNSGEVSVITNYQEIQTSIIKCKTKNIIYFKEISYTKYVNSLILRLFDLLRKCNKQVKLMIYDNRVGLAGLYKGMTIYNSTEYISNKSRIIRDTPKFVISEPNVIFLTDILTNIDPMFEIVIVYDRMRNPIDIVSGNNVTKVVVTNSKSNFDNCKDILKLNINSLIISGDPNIQNAMIIEDIPGYNGSTDSAKIMKYRKLPVRPGSGEKLIDTIFNKGRIDIGQM